MKVLAAEYVVSAAEPGQFPAGDLPEIAVAGRSNVGKSSLLNILLGRKNLARVSQTPGRTRLLTFFRVMLASQGAEGSPEKFLFVDLPGYGYARVAKAVHEQWGPMIEGYLSSRASLRGVVLLTDIRRGEEDEVNLVRWLEKQELGLVAVATKSDKLPRGRRLQALRDLETFLGVPVIGCSAVTGEGKDVVWKAIRELLARPRRAKAGSRCSSCPSVP
ncbi:MAG: YihA family ribosome biogenesis GTP-binding protein [Nitrospirae bacterium]|nr:MAG: YihA family ribosome biogenesis GTP-binding protein [Nitrospirota bacterium]